MKRKFAIICICVFAVAGISAGIINNTDSEAYVRETETIRAADVKTAEGIKESSSETHSRKDKVENKEMQSAVKVKNTEPATKASVSNSKKKTTSVKTETKQYSTSQPVHTHDWKEVYATKDVKKTRYVPYTKCYSCNADMTGNPNHIDAHLLNGESNVHYGTEYKEEVYYESERYISGYKCSCGAVK